MGKRKPIIRVRISTNADIHFIFNKDFTDWYDFADWLKQQNLGRNKITIHNWEYV